MGWESRTRGGRYYTQSQKVGGRVIRRYIGRGAYGEAVAALDAAERAERAACRAVWIARCAELEQVDLVLRDFETSIEAWTRATLQRAGFHRRRGEWRKRSTPMNPRNQTNNAVMPSHALEQPAIRSMLESGELMELMRRASGGDETVLATIIPILEAIPGGWNVLTDLGIAAERAWVELVAGDDPLLQLALRQKLDLLREEVKGPASTPLEALLAERVVLTWLAVQHADYEAARFFQHGGPLSQANYHQERQERAQRRHVSAIRALAQVRRLRLPTVQVNIGEKQINVAG